MTQPPIVPIPPLPPTVDVPTRLREAAGTLRVWLVLSAVWLIPNTVYWLLVPALSAPLEGRGSPGVWLEPLVVEAAVTVLTGAGIALLLPALRRGVRTVRLTLAWGMLALTLAHLGTLLFAVGMAFIAMIGGMAAPAGGGSPVNGPLLSAMAAAVLDLILIVVGATCFGRLFSARPPRFGAGPEMPPYPFVIR